MEIVAVVNLSRKHVRRLTLRLTPALPCVLAASSHFFERNRKKAKGCLLLRMIPLPPRDIHTVQYSAVQLIVLYVDGV